jgi:16S rRNA (uracil1498-N3)-methyltransferase
MSVTRRLSVDTVAAGALVVTGAKARYLASVLRLGAGAHVTVFGTGREADAEIVSARADRVELTVNEPRNATSADRAASGAMAARSVTLVYALSKGDKVDAVVRDATELGATAIVLAETERSVVRIEGDRAEKKTQRWRRIAEEAARQSGRALVPTVDGPLAFEDALTCVQDAHKFVLDPSAPERLGALLGALANQAGSGIPDATNDAGMAFAVGPEGGFSEREIEIARAQGFRAASLGGATLRTETVPTAVLGALLVLAK